MQADPLGLASTPIDRDPLDLAQWGSQSLGTAGPQLCLRPRKKRSVSVKARRRGASGTRPVALVPSEAYERRREIMKNLAGGLPANCLIPATKRKLDSGGRNNPEAVVPEVVGDIPFQQAPAPTAFTERYLEVDAAAKNEVDLAAKVQSMSLEDNPGLQVPVVDLTRSPTPALTPGTTAVNLEESSSSSSSSEMEVPTAGPTAAAAGEALEAARAAARAATAQMQEID